MNINDKKFDKICHNTLKTIENLQFIEESLDFLVTNTIKLNKHIKEVKKDIFSYRQQLNNCIINNKGGKDET